MKLATTSKKPFWELDYGPDWEQQRDRALRRDRYCCRTCGVSVKGTSRRAVHHIVSRSKGGTNALSNLKTECSTCHDKEHPHLQRLHANRKTNKYRPNLFGDMSSSARTKSFHSKKSRSLF